MVRLIHLTSVVLPEFAGPMMAKICPLGMSSETPASAVLAPYGDRDVLEPDGCVHRLTYHFFRERRRARSRIDTLLTIKTNPISTTAVPY